MSSKNGTTVQKLLIILAFSLVIGCQVNTKAKRESFIYNFNTNIGRQTDTEELIRYYGSGQLEHVKLVEVVKKQDGVTHVIIEWGPEGCRVAEVYKDDVFVDWYFVRNRDQCYTMVDWGGPW